jgi:hypothetical protein
MGRLESFVGDGSLAGPRAAAGDLAQTGAARTVDGALRTAASR